MNNASILLHKAIRTTVYSGLAVIVGALSIFAFQKAQDIHSSEAPQLFPTALAGHYCSVKPTTSGRSGDDDGSSRHGGDSGSSRGGSSSRGGGSSCR